MMVDSASYQNITTDAELRQYCDELAQAESIGLDTEFVAEDTFRPVLCLVQVAAAGRLAIIDPLGIEDFTPFWETLARPGHVTIVHSGRGEVEFCLQAIGRFPAELFDVQLAAGLVGREYPAGYCSLVSRLLGEALSKHETRTDWRRRPLSPRQVDYALDDVRYLHPLRARLGARLVQLGRRAWMDEEMAAWQEEIHRATTEERWWRVSGNANLGGRALAIVRELWRWRHAEAERRNKPPRQILRDDLIIELAKRQSADIKHIQALRGMEWGRLRSQLAEISQCIHRGLETPEKDFARPAYRETPPQLAMLGQFLSSALGSICRQAHLAPSLVGTPSDVRELILYRTAAENNPEPPLLARGWRADVVGRLFEDLLEGKKAIRIGDPMSEHPLVIEPVNPAESGGDETPTAVTNDP
jgi:ribonuclease D